MDIESFVSQALEQLGAGIEKARSKPGITVSPRPLLSERDNTAADRAVSHRGRDIISFVEFDLSVAVTSRVEGGAEAKAQLQVIGLDLGGA